MAELKTKPTSSDVISFLNSIGEVTKRNDSFTLLEIYRTATGIEPKMWGEAIVGFGDYHYKSDSGREGDWFRTGFSPRKQNLTLYFFPFPFDQEHDLLNKLGKYKTGKGCLYIKKLSDVDVNVLQQLINKSLGKV
jgi:hypothetical protein